MLVTSAAEGGASCHDDESLRYAATKDAIERYIVTIYRLSVLNRTEWVSPCSTESFGVTGTRPIARTTLITAALGAVEEGVLEGRAAFSVDRWEVGVGEAAAVAAGLARGTCD